MYNYTTIAEKTNHIHNQIIQDQTKLPKQYWSKECRDTTVSLHNGGLIKDPLKLPNTIVMQCTGGLKGDLNWSLMMPRDV